ncbi:acetyltransferase (GNAT) family protein [Limimaricola soesokkakensis]|uniref:Acetyltransferase (GNAT) family protein n=1 Tax=Limimaricola soesokkakensis TaxID=1343159 RepID=A0A1X6YRC6_9RHOB|nr:GNAT family N-acetyltransferase [Limimaricola soesokkakensis]PSK88236.1 acetyltransferase (GNAT) family protein [Limimaricola soesokkakensis]SLN28246.1 putative acetyltransferase [Limimaricola soesokkakensis]
MTPQAGFATLAATWPAAATRDLGPMRLRDGAGGGSRVSATTLEGPWQPADVIAAETAMRAAGQVPLFMLRQGEDDLDAALGARGYGIIDPTLILAAPPDKLETGSPRAVWPPHPEQIAIWEAGGVGPSRIAVMQRVTAPKAVLRAAQACAFVACHERHAMLHALEVAAPARRRGTGRALMAMAAGWARAAGAQSLCLAVTRANAPARALYADLGYAELTGYHYRRAAA